MAELGPVDMLVNSAGISYPGEFDTLPVSQFRVSIRLAIYLILQVEDVKIIISQYICFVALHKGVIIPNCVS